PSARQPTSSCRGWPTSSLSGPSSVPSMRCASGCMRVGDHLPDDQAEVVLSTHVEEWIADNIDGAQWDELLDDITALFAMPWGKHPLSNRNATDQLAGL